MREREAMRWLQLTYKVPSEPSQKRVWVWRRLQNLGAFALQNSVYLLPFAEEVEKQFRQLVHDIHEMGGEACLFSVVALDPSDEQRILQTLIDARHREYQEAVSLCARLLTRAQAFLDGQNWDERAHTEFAELLEKVHILFRSAKRHDLLEGLTAPKRAAAAECLAICEQIFRLLLARDYTRARRVLELSSDFLHSPVEESASGTPGALVATSEMESALRGDDCAGFPELPI